MASRISYAVSAQPVYLMDDATGLPVHTLEDTVGKSLAGSGSISVTTYGATTYVAHDASTSLVSAGGPVCDTSDDTITGGAATAVGAVFIRHSGLDLDNAATTALVSIKTAAAGTVMCQIGAGEAVVLPRTTNSVAVTCASGTVRLEYAVIRAT